MKTAYFSTIACLLLLSSAAYAVDLSAYNGVYPFDEIGGYAFFDNPAVKSAIDGVAGSGVSDWIAELGVGMPIELQDDGLIAIVCEQHNCPGNNAAVAITVSGTLIAACLYSEDGDHGAPRDKLRWVSPRFDKQIDNKDDVGCPQDASEFLDA
jgi:hypothetical protein